jgi:hypothetical protein
VEQTTVDDVAATAGFERILKPSGEVASQSACPLYQAAQRRKITVFTYEKGL